MEKTLTLPPLVRGNVTGFLDFFVDEITIFRNLLFLTDVVTQVQWWGDISPVYIRPRRVNTPQARKRVGYLKAYIHSARYAIKTKLELFKSYLKACEVLEVSVLEAVENYVVGSAFLKNLIGLLNTGELITPIFNYAGEEIGEVKIHVDFFSKTQGKREPYVQVSDEEVSHMKGDYKSLPEIETTGDSSKVLYFDLGLNQNRFKSDKNISGQVKKFSKNSVKTKLKQPKGVCNLQNEKDWGVQEIPSKERKVLDYLLGSDMSKEDEETALNDFKKMSPSHNIVTSINHLCLSVSEPEKKSSLRFDLSNPIERDYYEKFFAETSQSEFQNERPTMWEKWKETQVKRENEGEDCVNERFESGCTRCKNFKKLDELDNVIECLKHFEEKVVVWEKDAGEINLKNPK